MASFVGSGDYKYEIVPSWPKMLRYWHFGGPSDARGHQNSCSGLPIQNMRGLTLEARRAAGPCYAPRAQRALRYGGGIVSSVMNQSSSGPSMPRNATGTTRGTAAASLATAGGPASGRSGGCP